VAVLCIFTRYTFKGCLFMIAGIRDVQPATSDVRSLGKLFTLMPITATLAFFGTFSMAGFPLPCLNGFYSKELFFESSLALQKQTTGFANLLVTIVPYLAVVGSIITFVYSMYLF